MITTERCCEEINRLTSKHEILITPIRIASNTSILGRHPFQRLSKFKQTSVNLRFESIPRLSSQARNLLQTITTQGLVKTFIRKLKENIQMTDLSVLFGNNLHSPETCCKDGYQLDNLKINFIYGINVFQQSSRKIKVWQLFQICLMIMGLLYFPFCLSFLDQNDQTIDIVIVICTVLDIFIQLNTSIIEEGQILNDRIKILKHYYRSALIIDSTICFFIMVLELSTFNKYLLLVCICMIIIASWIKCQNKLAELFEEDLFSQLISTDLQDLLRLPLILLYASHLIACIWHFIGIQSVDYGCTWIMLAQLQDSNYWIQYSKSLYWAIMTMTTIGYGDIVPANPIEILTSIIIMLISTCLFGYSINSIGIIVQNLNKKKSYYNKQLLIINQYMKMYTVDPLIQNRVRNYLKYYLEWEQREDSQELLTIQNKLPQSLQSDLEQNIKIQIFNQIPFFKNHFTQYTQDKVIKLMELIQYTPQEYIFRQNEYSQYYLYFIFSGRVKIYESQSQYQFQELKEGDVFGLQQFITGQPPRLTATSEGFTRIYRISRDKFESILDKDSQDFEIFKDIIYKIQQTQDFKLINLSCSICKKYNHEQSKCNLLNPKFDKESIICRSNFRINDRQRFKRKQSRVNTRMELNTIQERCNELNAPPSITEALSEYDKLPLSSHDLNDQILSEMDQLNKSSNGFDINQHEDLVLPYPVPSFKTPAIFVSTQNERLKIQIPINEHCKVQRKQSWGTTKEKDLKSVSQEFKSNENEITEFNIDKAKNYVYFQSQYNHQQILFNKPYKIYKEASKYMFNYQAQKIMNRIRYKLLKQTAGRSPQFENQLFP